MKDTRVLAVLLVALILFHEGGAATTEPLSSTVSASPSPTPKGSGAGTSGMNWSVLVTGLVFAFPCFIKLL